MPSKMSSAKWRLFYPGRWVNSADWDRITPYGATKLGHHSGDVLFRSNASSEPMLTYWHSSVRNRSRRSWDQITLICIQENAYENVVWKYLAPCPLIASSNYAFTDSDSCFSFARHQAIIGTNASLLSIGPLWIYFSENWIKATICIKKEWIWKFYFLTGGYFVSV